MRKLIIANCIRNINCDFLPEAPNVNQKENPVRLVGYHVDGKKYWVATDRYGITAEEVAYIYTLR